MDRQYISNGIQTSISLIVDEVQTSIEIFTSCKEQNERQFWFNSYGLKKY